MRLSWVTVVWSATASACLTVYLLVRAAQLARKLQASDAQLLDNKRRIDDAAAARTCCKEMRAKLLESEARFRSIANTAPVMLWMSGTDKLCTFFNQGWLHYAGRTLQQELGNGWADG